MPDGSASCARIGFRRKGNALDALESWLIDHIAAFASTYGLMSNYAYLIGWKLTDYLEAKRRLQLEQITSDAHYVGQVLEGFVNDNAREVLFYTAKAYRTIYDAFWMKGGQYAMRDDWASEAIKNLHNEMVGRIHFRADVVLKHVGADTEWHSFVDMMDAASSLPSLRDLHEQELGFRQWLLINDLEARELAASRSVMPTSSASRSATCASPARIVMKPASWRNRAARRRRRAVAGDEGAAGLCRGRQDEAAGPAVAVARRDRASRSAPLVHRGVQPGLECLSRGQLRRRAGTYERARAGSCRTAPTSTTTWAISGWRSMIIRKRRR